MINDRVVQKLKALNERYGAMLDDEAFEALDHAIEALQGCEVGRCPICSRWLETRCPVCGPVEPNGDDAHALAMEFESLLDDTLVPNEPLEVYSSNSFRRVGLKSQYKEVLYATRDRSDGHPNFSNYALLDALVCAFNAMLARRTENRSAPPGDQPGG
jgi:hypothetical protein